MHIDDLHFRKEILPLFDFVQNEFSRDSLTGLLTDFPQSLDEVMGRQQIIKALIRNEALHGPGVYHPSEFHEVYGTLENMRNRGAGLSGTS